MPEAWGVQRPGTYGNGGGGDPELNVAVAVIGPFTAIVQLAASVLQGPDHPANQKPVSAVAVNVMADPPGTGVVQVGPQSMPAGVEVTVPVRGAAFVGPPTRKKEGTGV